MSRSRSAPKVLSLFTGAGGLDLGLEAAGFTPALCVEIDEDSRETLRQNRPRWSISEPGDIHSLEPASLLQQAQLKPGEVELLAGGPPCQPFSKSAYWANGDGQRLKDPRARTLDAYLNVVETTLPKALLLENVKGFAYSGKDEALKLLQRRVGAINRVHKTNYKLETIHLNAADFGVPQHRERVFLVANIDGRPFELPSPTHGTGAGKEPYLTSWDAIGDLDYSGWPPELDPKGRWADLLPSIPEGQNYLWHTPRNQENGGVPLFGWRTRYWSFLLKLAKDRPAWTIQAAPGPATGPFHWRSRRLSVQELSRIQTFPSGYQFHGDLASCHRQIGNAVPSAIGELFGLEIRRQFFGQRVRRQLRLIPPRRDECPSRQRRSRVPKRYLRLRADHKDHPGPGLGPGARKTKLR